MPVIHVSGFARPTARGRCAGRVAKRTSISAQSTGDDLSSVSGVAIVAISRRAARPTRYARAASRRRRQYTAMQIGEPYVFSEAEQKASREKLWTPSLFKKTWDHYRIEAGRLTV